MPEVSPSATIDFVALKIACNGMLSPQTYERIYRSAQSAPEGICVEVGTAHGAATVAMALAIRDKNEASKIYTFDRLEGGSRSRWGSQANNLEIVKSHFAEYKVDAVIELNVGEVETLAHVVPAETPISMLVLDADGMIDRDFRLFYNQMPEGGVIVIDDCNDIAKVARKRGRRISVDLKHKLTYELFQYYQSEGLLEHVGQIGATAFARKTARTQPVDFSKLDSLVAYRRCTQSEGRLPSIAMNARRGLYSWLQERMPGVLNLAYRAKIKMGG